MATVPCSIFFFFFYFFDASADTIRIMCAKNGECVSISYQFLYFQIFSYMLDKLAAKSIDLSEKTFVDKESVIFLSLSGCGAGLAAIAS